ncbi:MAG TPA: glycoside hydrolase family 15 protein [archaeon]|nr:glycoside hydrolase family 15 protein [archaeon]
MEKKIRRIYKKSIEVLKKCSLENGAIISADVSNPYYPKNVQEYDYVWPRDAAYTCVVCDLIGLKKIPRRFFEWCWERSELFKEKGFFLGNKFNPQGGVTGELVGYKYVKRLPPELKKVFTFLNIRGSEFQPDETGSLLWAMWHNSKSNSTDEFKDMIIKVADGICSVWKNTHFNLPSFDIWEERVALPENSEKHTYSVAMCLRGLECASQIIKPKDRWKVCMRQMRTEVEEAYKKNLRYFVRTFGDRKVDKIIDSSMFALVWPCEIFDANDERIVNTVKEIIKRNDVNGGIMRYRNDKYDGRINWGKLISGGGGSWPVLNFWSSIYFSKLGNSEKSLKYFNWVVERIDDYIPEQIKNGKPASIMPLAWSHSMFIIAGKMLKLF